MLSNLHPLSLWSFLIALVSLIGIVVLTILNKQVPSQLNDALFVTLGSGGASGLVAKPAVQQ
jgi:hypothetical protein